MATPIASVGFNYAFPGKVGGTGTNFDIFTAPSNANAAAVLALPVTSSGQQVDVKATGYIYGHGATTLTNFVLQSGTSLTSTSNATLVTIASNTAVTQSTLIPWALKISLNGDAASGIVQVISSSFVLDGVSETLTVTGSGAILSGVTYAGPGAAINLVLGFKFTVSDALNAAYITQFVAEE
jgi:hypothetical protein